jgi:glyoxylase-like metal-dependent hydrolase (beta-lactamase superfamily II)
MMQIVLKASDWKPEDVRTVIITHFHADHICGLSGFSNARFMASGSAFVRLKAMSPFRRLRHGVFFEFLPLDFEDRLIAFETLPEVVLPFGLGPGRDLFGTGEVLSIDLPGHALGHTGLLWPRLEQPLLYAADAQWLGAALHGGRVPRGPARLVYDDEDKMLRSLERLRRAVAAGCRIQLCHELSEDQP